MSLIGAPIPSEPLPWENVDYENNISDDESSDETDEDVSSLHSDTEGESDIDNEQPLKRKKKTKVFSIPVAYYKNKLHEEEYFSE